MAQALEGEADGVDEVHAGAHQTIAELEAEQIVLGLGGAVLERMQQGHVRPGQPGEHHGIAAVALALVAGDGVELAGIGHDDRGSEAGEVTADPRAVRPGFQRHGGGGILREQRARADAIIEQRPFVNDLAGGIQDADVMAAIAEIEAKGEPAGSSRGGREGGTTDGVVLVWFV